MMNRASQLFPQPIRPGYPVESNGNSPENSNKARQGDQLKPAETTQLTISDDRTNQREIDKRNLSALSHEKPEKDQDHQMQLMLLEQQNKRRLMMARQEQDSIERDRDAIQQEQQTSQRMRNPDLKRTRSPLPNIVRNTAESPTGQTSWDPIRRPAASNRTVRPNHIRPDTQDDRLCTKEVQALREQMSLLEAKLSQYESTGEAPSPSRFQYLYRLRQVAGNDDNDDDDDDGEMEPTSRVFSDPPEIVYDHDENGHLRCSLPLRDLDLFLALHQDISFVVFRDYDRQFETDSSRAEDMPQVPDPLSESIYPVASNLKDALKVLFDEIPGFQDIQNRYEWTGEIFAPYHFLYHSREELDELNNKLPQSTKSHLDLLLMYVEENFGDEYDTVDSLLKEKKITSGYINYLFKPGEVIVEAKGQDYIGYVASSWIIEGPNESNSENVPHASEMPTRTFKLLPQTTRKRPGRRKGPHIKRQKPKSKHSSANIPKTLKAWTLDFDGNFFRSFKTLTVKVPHGKPTEAVNESGEPSACQDISDEAQPICCLNVFPLKYAPEAVREILKRRGNTFWKCRDRRLVSYHGERSGRGVDMTDERYMIDMDSYKKLHPPILTPQESSTGLKGISAEAINDPNDKYQFLLPLHIKGYNLRHKKWFEISADCISDVKWNREAFQSLVMERKSKELIQALVTSQIEAEKATDLISGKGNGLILLLHGGPGTGKTLTAESVAEIAEKPLYRVTCGDVGTKAEQVEQYLESVLYLGRIWGCVVLLDEADVFLEQRSLEDLERNALVSVFLRVLEYYDGILVLTSNRVGTFDEAFRSRIQLALHYPNLGPPQRFRIWQTFIDRLSKMPNEEQIDIDDLRDHLHLLKEEKMNGRQIRNVITTARQYAKWKNEPLTYEYLKDAIEVSCRFDGYLSKLHGGFSDDEIAQDDGLRLA